MKRILVLASVVLLLAPALAFIPTAASSAIIIGHPNRHTLVVRHVGHPMRPGWGHGPMRPGQFWHRGGWFGRVHGPAFHYPHGWRYRAWGIGAILPPLFLAPDYYYDDYATLGLQAPPPGYRWVRYGPDLLLVNLRTGEVEDVVNDVFD